MNAGQLTSICILSEEERRLLREYRLTIIPPRRSSKSSTPSVTPNGSSISTGSSGISSASSSSCSSSSSTSSSSSSCISSSGYISSKSISIGSIESSTTTDAGTLTHFIYGDPSQNDQNNQYKNHTVEPQKTHLDYNPKHHNHQNHHNHQHHNHYHHRQDNNNNHHHNNHDHDHLDHDHHDHHHHHHRNNHKRHRNNSTSTIKLPPGDLNEMTELSSNLSILKLLGPGISNQSRSHVNGLEIDTTNGNELVSNSKNTTETGDNTISNDSDDLSTAALNEQLSGLNNLNYVNQKFRPFAQKSDSGGIYIFEKVDYLKKLNMRRKASKKSKKLKKSSLSKTLTTNGIATRTTNKSTAKTSTTATTTTTTTTTSTTTTDHGS